MLIDDIIQFSRRAQAGRDAGRRHAAAVVARDPLPT